MVLFGGAPGDRVRFSIAHELGHLVLHQSLHGTSMEHEANLFAQELLLPEAAMRREMAGGITLASLATIKQRWGVSMAALAMRATELNLISKRQLSYLMAKLNSHGWRTQEPVEIIMEKPRGLRKMIEVLYGEQIDYHRLGNDLRMPPHFVKRLVESHATKAEFNVATVAGGTKRERGRTLTFGRVPTAEKNSADEADITSAHPS